MLAMLLNNKIRTASEVSAGLCVIIIIRQSCQKGSQKTYLLDTQFIIKADNNNIIRFICILYHLAFSGLVFLLKKKKITFTYLFRFGKAPK